MSWYIVCKHEANMYVTATLIVINSAAAIICDNFND